VTDLIAGSVTIADLYRELVGMRSDLTRVLGHQEATELRNITADAIHADVEVRLRALERFRYTLAGLAIVGGAASGFVGYLLGHAVR
jgi:hypothetical protein